MAWQIPAAMTGGAILGYFGQKEANRVNINLAREANAAAQANAREQMAFQERMSNSAHQREAADLIAANINPIMSAKAGASTPTGAAGGTSAADVKNPFEGAAASAKEIAFAAQQFKKGQSEIELLGAQKKNQESSTRYNLAAAAKSAVDAEVARKGIPESDIKNRLYKMAEPYLEKWEEADRFSSKPQRDLPNATKKAVDMHLRNEEKRFNLGPMR